MFRAPRCAVLGIGLMLAAASTQAREVEFSVENRIVGDSNVFGGNRDRVADGYYAFSPRFVVRENSSNLHYLLAYRPVSKTYFTIEGINGVDHWSQGVLSWRPTAIDQLEFNGNLWNSRGLRRVQGSTPSSALEVSNGERSQRSEVKLSYNRGLSKTISLQLSGFFNDVNFSRSASIDSRSYSVQLGTQFVISPITAVGLSGSVRRRLNSVGGGSAFTTTTESWNIGASLRRSLSPTFDVSVQAGPTFFDTRRERPGFPTAQSQSESYFVAASVDKKWLHSKLSTSYTRSESGGGGTATTSIFDNVTAVFDYNLSRRWLFQLVGTWIQSKEISAGSGASKRETTQYRALARATRRISDRLSVMGQFSFFTEDTKKTTGSGSTGEVYSGFVSLSYTFEPIVF